MTEIGVFGRYLYAVGKNEEAARFSGIRTGRVIAAYAICAVLTALSSIFLAMYTRAILPSSHGNVYELYAIAAAVQAAFRSAAAKARSSASCLGPSCCRCFRTSSTCWAFRRFLISR